jgi:hypothetical protein
MEGGLGITNFGEHTLLALNILRFQKRAPNFHIAFDMVKGLNPLQSWALTNYELSRDQVLTTSLGIHTIFAMDRLLREGREANNQDAFKLVSGLNEFQTRGITDYDLNRTQVLDPRFNESMLTVMGVLLSRSPDAKGGYLYETAIHLLEYQSRGLQLKLTLEQVGIVVVDNNFKNECKDNRFSAEHIDATAHLMEIENMDSEEAYQVALSLNSTQISGMINFGLRLDQVQHPFFSNDQWGLVELIEQLIQEDGFEQEDISIPFDQEQQKKVRNIFDLMLPFIAINQGTENTQTEIQITENEMLSVPEETAGFASMPLLDNKQSIEEEENLTEDIRRLEINKNYPSQGTDLSNGGHSHGSSKDRKLAAQDRKKSKNESVDQNLQEHHQNTGGDLERRAQGIQEGTTVQSNIAEQVVEVGNSFENPSRSPAALFPSNTQSPRSTNSGGASKRQKRVHKHKRKKKRF